jgi:arabinofuranosyltransferase
VAGVVMAMAGAATLAGERFGERLLVPAGALAVVSLPPMWTFATSGLEGGLTFAWLGACTWVLGRWSRTEGPLPASAAALVGLGPLVRPDLAVFTLAFLVVALTCRAGRRRVVLAALAAPVAYQVFRMGYYGVPVPTPAITKSASDAYWSAGWDYLRTSTQPYWLWFPVVVLLAAVVGPWLRQRRAAGDERAVLVAGAFLAGAAICTVYVVRVGGDFMHARLLLPSWFALAAPVAVVPLERRLAGAALLAPWVLAGLFGFRPAADDYHGFGQEGAATQVTWAAAGWDPDGGARAWFTGEGVFYNPVRLDAEPQPGRDPAVASFGIGVVAYALGPDVYVLDLLGLGDAVAAHLAIPDRSYPGHEKPLPPPWIAARLTTPGAALDESDFPFPTGFGTRPLGDPDRAPFEQRDADARRALTCGDLAELLASVDAPLTPGRFVDNLFGSLGRWRLEIPPEPADAVAAFCEN